jgi:hypothetical protein
MSDPTRAALEALREIKSFMAMGESAWTSAQLELSRRAVNRVADEAIALLAVSSGGAGEAQPGEHEWVKCDIGTACKTCGASGPYELPDTTPYRCFDARFVKPLGVWHRANSVCVDCGVPVPQGALCAPCHTVRSEPTPAPSGGAGEVQHAPPTAAQAADPATMCLECLGTGVAPRRALGTAAQARPTREQVEALDTYDMRGVGEVVSRSAVLALYPPAAAEGKQP